MCAQLQPLHAPIPKLIAHVIQTPTIPDWTVATDIWPDLNPHTLSQRTTFTDIPVYEHTPLYFEDLNSADAVMTYTGVRLWQALIEYWRSQRQSASSPTSSPTLATPFGPMTPGVMGQKRMIIEIAYIKMLASKYVLHIVRSRFLQILLKRSMSIAHIERNADLITSKMLLVVWKVLMAVILWCTDAVCGQIIIIQDASLCKLQLQTHFHAYLHEFASKELVNIAGVTWLITPGHSERLADFVIEFVKNYAGLTLPGTTTSISQPSDLARLVAIEYEGSGRLCGALLYLFSDDNFIVMQQPPGTYQAMTFVSRGKPAKRSSSRPTRPPPPAATYMSVIRSTTPAPAPPTPLSSSSSSVAMTPTYYSDTSSGSDSSYLEYTPAPATNDDEPGTPFGW